MGDELSEYTFGDMSYSGGRPDEGQDAGFGAGQEQSPKWFRDYMAQAAAQNKQLMDQVQALTAEKRQTEMANTFEEKGYHRSVASLYSGDPDKVDEWLSAHGSALAKSGDQQAQQRPPGDTGPTQQQQAVPSSVQADLQRMQQMGPTGANAPAANSDDELAAALAATNTPEEFLQVAQAHGWQYNAGNMGFM